MCRISWGLPSGKRFVVLSIVAVLVGLACAMLASAVAFGHLYTTGLVFGYGRLYPDAMLYMSTWYLAAGCLAYAGLVALIWRRGGPLMRIAGAAAGPMVAWGLLASWVTSFIFYGLHAWSPDATPDGLRWFLDGAPIHVWRAVARWLLGLAGLAGPLDPSVLRGGGTLPSPRELVLGVVNESMLAAVMTTVALLVIQQVAMSLRRTRRTA